MRSEEQIIGMIQKLGIIDGDLRHTPVVNALIWVIGYDEEENIWRDAQQDYHSKHNGALEPDFRLPIFLDWIGKGKFILDCGVHNGIHSNKFAENNQVVGVDLPCVIDRFKSKYKFPCYICDVNQNLIIFNDDSFDFVVAGELIEHLKSPKYFVAEVHRVLKPKGKFLISCPYKESEIQDPLHCCVVDDIFITEIFGNKFKILEKKIMKGAIIVLAQSTREKKLPFIHPEEEHYTKMRELVGDRKFNDVIEIGCGEGYLVTKFMDCSKKIVGYDKNINYILEARKKYKGITFEVIDLDVDRLTGNPDLVIMCDMIYYLKRYTQKKIMKNIHDILPKDGLLLISRHKGDEEHEFKSYKHLFKKIKGEWISWKGEPKIWYIALLKKV